MQIYKEPKSVRGSTSTLLNDQTEVLLDKLMKNICEMHIPTLDENPSLQDAHAAIRIFFRSTSFWSNNEIAIELKKLILKLQNMQHFRAATFVIEYLLERLAIKDLLDDKATS